MEPMVSSGTCPGCGMEMFIGAFVETPDGEEMHVCQVCHDNRFYNESAPDVSEIKSGNCSDDCESLPLR